MNVSDIVNKIDNLEIDDFSITVDFIDKIDIHLKNENLVGGGGLGKVYKMGNDNRIIKTIQPCEQRQNNKILNALCEDIGKRDKIIYLPNDGKNILRISNYIGEGVIGGLLNSLSIYTPHFVRTDGIYYSEINGGAYIIMEKVMTDVFTKITTISDIYIMLFQIAHGLYVAQKMNKFTHYDLHAGNIGYVNLDSRVNIEYNYRDREDTINNILCINQPKFNMKILDFGTSRMEINSLIINSKYDMFPTQTYGVYNPYNDFISLVGSLIFFNTDLTSKFNFLLGIDGVDELLSLLFGKKKKENMTSQNHVVYLRDKYFNRWRPKIIDIRPNNNKPFAETSEILEWLAKKLIDLGRATGNYNSDNPYLLKTQQLPKNNNYVISREIAIYKELHRIDVGIYTLTFPLKLENNFSVNHTGNQNKIFLDVYVHCGLINTQQAFQNGYSFATTCCKIDPLSFISSKFGIAINGGFFDINNTFEMIGYYRQLLGNKYYETNNTLEGFYQKYYGVVVVTDNGIEIRRSFPIKETVDAFVAGPLLIYNGEPVFTLSTLNESVNIDGKNVKIFQCKNAPVVDSGKKIITDSDNNSHFNCGQIKPGELSHGSNSNPRSMLIIRQQPDFDVIFVVVEGRSSSSDGVDFYNLVEIAQKLNAFHAINLDGGRSSTIVHRSPSNENSVISPIYRNSYPVGNVLSLTK